MRKTKFMTQKEILAFEKNNKARENGIVKHALYKLKRDGYIVWKPLNIWGQRDIFGVFDLIAAKGWEIVFIQLTSTRHAKDRYNKIAAFCWKNHINFRNAYVWAWDEKKMTFSVQRIT